MLKTLSIGIPTIPANIIVTNNNTNTQQMIDINWNHSTDVNDATTTVETLPYINKYNVSYITIESLKYQTLILIPYNAG